MSKTIAIIKFPENIPFNDGLQWGDKAKIARRSGKSYSYIKKILRGERRMTNKIENIINEFNSFNLN